MDEKNGKNPFLALTVATVLFAALGVVHYLQEPYKDVRPPVPEFHEPSETIRARLWQDPFQAVLDHVKAKEGKEKKSDKKAQEGKKPTTSDDMVSGVINWSGCSYLKDPLSDEILERQKKGTLTVLAVMVFGGPYAELAESRLRQRYAVLAGLNRMNFYPEDAERIGCLKIITKKDDHEFTLSNVIPFEWLSKDNRKGSVLLL